MLNQRLQAAREIAEQLIAAERAIDNAVAQVAALTACMPLARMEANIAAQVGHEALVRTAGSMTSLIERRTDPGMPPWPARSSPRTKRWRKPRTWWVSVRSPWVGAPTRAPTRCPGCRSCSLRLPKADD